VPSPSSLLDTWTTKKKLESFSLSLPSLLFNVAIGSRGKFLSSLYGMGRSWSELLPLNWILV